ncbi:hypothetical protein CHS0354_026526 [Potamilus streckersoni]|uniref:Fibronectin type-III domain-containing protein n=1 Tax=Potamilus streckersoni TaxID=2493646 RepID=A0AAE0RQ30_9BIVA|nr:hypothetical protein CHS0354_026526 [Potamilus streckersoni]
MQVDHANKTTQYSEKIEKLNPGTKNKISVQAVNWIGQGNVCGSKSCVTLAGKPSLVTAIQTEARTMTTTTLKWKQTAMETGTIYNISVQAMNSEGLSDEGTIFAVQTLDDRKPIQTGEEYKRKYPFAALKTGDKIPLGRFKLLNSTILILAAKK